MAWSDGYEYQEFEGPEARMARDEVERQDRIHAAIGWLFWSLSPADSARELFSFEERRVWGLKRYRKYPERG